MSVGALRALLVVLGAARGGEEVRAAAAVAVAAATARAGHAAPPRQLQEALQLISLLRKNARHRRVQSGSGCFYGAGCAVDEAEAARWAEQSRALAG